MKRIALFETIMVLTQRFIQRVDMCIYVQTERAQVAQSIKLHKRWKILKIITLAEVLGAVGLHGFL